MSVKKYFFVCLSVASFLFIVSCTTISPVTSLPSTKQEIIDTKTDNEALVSRTIKNSTKLYNSTKNFPVLTKTDSNSVQINAFIASIVMRAENDFILFCNKERSLPVNAPWEFFSSWELSELTKSHFSALLKIYTFTGGAHGNTSLIPLNFDLSTGTEILLADLRSFNRAESTIQKADWQAWLVWLDKLSDRAYDLLLVELNKIEDFTPDLEWVKNGVSPTEENFRTFTIKDNKITFTFSQYQVVPYAYGMPSITIPLKELR